MVFLFYLAVILAVAFTHALRARGRRVEILLVYLVAGYYGICMTLAAWQHLRNPSLLAQYKGWPLSVPMHALYAFALLGLALSAILTIWHRGRYLLGPSISGSILVFGGAYVHASEVLASGKFSLSRDGPEFILDIVVPVSILILLVVYEMNWRSKLQEP